MAINADKPHLWKKDIQASVDLFNDWFMRFAPRAYRDTRIETTKQVEDALRITNDLVSITPDVLKGNPGILPTLRMAACPPLARDRLIGLAYAAKNVVNVMEKGRLPVRMRASELTENLARIAETITRMLDHDIFPWIENKHKQQTKKNDTEQPPSLQTGSAELCRTRSSEMPKNNASSPTWPSSWRNETTNRNRTHHQSP